MNYQSTDSATSDSEDGIRFKTATTRTKSKRSEEPARDSSSRRRDGRHRSRSRSPRRRSEHGKRRTTHRRSRSRERNAIEENHANSDSIKSNKHSHAERHSTKRVDIPATPSRSQNQNKDKPDKQEDVCGPAIPPSVIQKKPTTNKCDTSGPALPAPATQSADSPDNSVCGPALPPHLLNRTPVNDTKKTVDDSKKTVDESKKTIGPCIPDDVRKRLEESTNSNSVESAAEMIESSDDDTYGPLPIDAAPTSRAHIALEERALEMQLQSLEPRAGDDEPAREEWMLELPGVRAVASLGLANRQFRAKAGPDLSDRSSWTDTPQSGARSAVKKAVDKSVELQRAAEADAIRRRDDEQEALVKKAKKKHKRDKSLMQQHQDKLNAKKKEEQVKGTTERRPFNRDTDLKVHQFDDAQKKAIMKKAQLLDDRFSQGKSKFL